MTADTEGSKYLSELRTALTGMTLSDREEIIDEIRAHIQERSRESGMTIAQIVGKLGPAAELAHDYNRGVLLRRASRSQSPWLLLGVTYRWARTGIQGFGLFLLAFCGFATAAAFMLCALLKPLFPEETGLWIGPHGVNLGFRPGGAEGATEVLGPWFIQVALLIGVGLLAGTTASVRALLPRLKQSSSLVRRSGEVAQVG
jgi:HAAS